MRHIFSRRVTLPLIGSVPIATVFLASATITALAWFAFLANVARQQFTATVAAAPVEADIFVNFPECTLLAGSGAATPGSIDPGDEDKVICDVTGFDDTSVVLSGQKISNQETVPVVVSFILPAANACYDLVQVDGDINTTLAPSEQQRYAWEWRGTGDGVSTGTITCAATTLGPFNVEVSVIVP